MAGVHDFKKLESEIHEKIFDNLTLLAELYPTSNDFKKFIKKDMFVKNNKAAFFEVVYYLLNILNPILTAEKLTSWPPYEIKLEAKFRSELLSYINELNQLYDSVKIPQVMASHLISPGGYKVAHFVFKLTQLVMFEHLKKTNELLYPPTVSELTSNVQIDNLVKEKCSIEREIQASLEDFENYHKQCLEKSQKIMDTLSTINRNLEDAKNINKITREEFNQKYPNYPLFENLKEKFECLTNKWSSLETVIETIKTVTNLLNYLNSSDASLEYDKEHLNLPNGILHIIKKGEELNLTELFQGLNVLLGYQALEIPNIDHLCSDKNKEVLNDLCRIYLEIARKGKEEISQFEDSIRNLSEKIKLLETIDNNIQKNIFNS